MVPAPPAPRRGGQRSPGGWVVYLLRCGDGSLYAGITNDLERRLAAHNAGRGAAYTRSHGPVRVVYSERAADRSEASRREAELKRLSREEKLALVRRAAGKPSRRRRRPGSAAGSGRPDRCR
ncbi:MAG: GIY-YIG nuclease family protein [Deltaproteobacteria bacterium]